jgi:adenine-specific DNA-methyltransferase
VIDSYIVDFCCYKHKLIIELDGGQHNEAENMQKDKHRQEYLEKLGYRVLRVWNNEINDNIDGLGEKIFEILEN